MPGTRDDSEIAFVTVHAEVLRRFVVGVQTSDWDDLHTCPYDGIAIEGFLQPKLLQSHFTTALNLTLVLAAFFLFDLDGTLRTAVLELDLRAYRPSMTEVIAHVNHHVRQIKLAVMIVGKPLGVLAITKIVVGVETMFGGNLTVTADSKTSCFTNFWG